MSNLELYGDKAKLSAPVASNRGPGVYRAGLKRIFDIALALALMPIVLPLIAILAGLVSLDGGRGFYSQPRIGRDGRPFKFWKIRSMATDAEEMLRRHLESDPAAAAEWRETQKLTRDPRITRIGAFLRATSLDELPQVFNVLMGDMSFVGPRPFMPQQMALYGHDGAYYDLRPGITGLWQVESRNAGCFKDRVRYDNAYASALSFPNDVRILARTFRRVFTADGR